MAESKIVDASAESIFAAGGIPKNKPYIIPGIGRVWIRTITNLEFRQWAKKGKDEQDEGGDELYSDAALIQMCVADKNGQHLFTLDQIPKIAGLLQGYVLPLIKKCMAVNGIGEDAKKEILKNSEPTLNEGS